MSALPTQENKDSSARARRRVIIQHQFLILTNLRSISRYRQPKDHDPKLVHRPSSWGVSESHLLALTSTGSNFEGSQEIVGPKKSRVIQIAGETRMANQSSEDAKKEYIKKMGEALGAQFHALWQEIALLHLNWKEYVALFGTSEERIKRLNKSAPAFFRMLQDDLWTSTLLHIARLQDSPRSAGRSNLTIRNFTDLVHEDFRRPLAVLIDKAVADAEFARDWRNRVIAHTDLSLALQDGTADPLKEASREKVNAVLKSLSAVMNAVQQRYMDSVTAFDVASRHNGAEMLLCLVGDGLRARAASEERLKAAIESGSHEAIAAAIDKDLQEEI
jgi:AbiU2